MCRWVVFKSKEPVLLADLLTRPAHSVINQSFDSRLRMDEVRPLNGDGFGVGWYDPQEKQSPPCIFTSTLPAWNNLNLIRLAEKVKSPLLFAHVRAASSGFPISESNCHPWQYGNLMWMHNGYVSGFSKIKRRLQNTLPDPIFHSILGSTDSEWSFGLFLSQLQDPLKKVFEPEELKDAMSKTIELLRIWSEEAGITEPSLLNFAVTDGATIVCSRYINCSDREAASLYYSSGTRFDKLSDGRYQMVKRDKREEMVVVASEPITFERNDWCIVPDNTILIITPKLNVLLYPILDKFWVPPHAIETREKEVPWWSVVRRIKNDQGEISNGVVSGEKAM